MMFAVPGWSVSADKLKRQELADAEASKTKSSKKRNRGSAGAGAVKVTADKLPQLWEEHVERRGPQPDATTEDGNGPPKVPRRKRQRSTPSQTKDDYKVPVGTKGADLEPNEREKPKGKPQELQPGSKANNQAPQHGHAAAGAEASKLTPLQSNMREKLISSRFRYLNQTLYTTPSQDSLKLFADNPAFYDEYHQGFRRQVAAWPENPVDGFVDWICQRSANRPAKGGSERRHGKGERHPTSFPSDGQRVSAAEPLPRDVRSGLCTLADLGCGDASLARKLTSDLPSPPLHKKHKLRIESFDLAATSPLVTVADMRHLPLADGSVDVAIFCLALMGTNWVEFIDEAWRVLRWKGECWVAEVSSRFAGSQATQAGGSKGKGKGKGSDTGGKREQENGELGTVEEVTSVPKAGPDVSPFVGVLRRRGFVLQGEPDASNKMFVRMRFVKAASPRRQGAGAGRKGKKWAQDTDDAPSPEEESKVLKPCVYKTR